jgi:hypothetical protein
MTCATLARLAERRGAGIGRAPPILLSMLAEACAAASRSRGLT